MGKPLKFSICTLIAGLTLGSFGCSKEQTLTNDQKQSALLAAQSAALGAFESFDAVNHTYNTADYVYLPTTCETSENFESYPSYIQTFGDSCKLQLRVSGNVNAVSTSRALGEHAAEITYDSGTTQKDEFKTSKLYLKLNSITDVLDSDVTFRLKLKGTVTLDGVGDVGVKGDSKIVHNSEGIQAEYLLFLTFPDFNAEVRIRRNGTNVDNLTNDVTMNGEDLQPGQISSLTSGSLKFPTEFRPKSSTETLRSISTGKSKTDTPSPEQPSAVDSGSE